MSLRTVLLRLTIILSCWLQSYHSVLAVNVTVQDTDPSIVYQPPESWHSSSDSCSTCLAPEILASYHEAIHPAATKDTDDIPAASASRTSAALTSASSTTDSDDSDGDGDTNDGDHDGDSRSGSNSGKGKKRALSRRFVRPRLDMDDEGFVDPDVTVSFNFTGSAIYLFCIQPLGVPAVNGTPTNMNLTFTLDDKPSGRFDSVGTPGATGFQANKSVLSLNGLQEGPHQLLVNVGQDSTFLLDHVIYTSITAQSNDNGTSTTTDSPTPLGQSSPSSSIDPNVKRRNIATFAGAVGGSVGVLGIFSLCLALSIIRRRRLAALRDRRDRESLHTNGSDDSPRMSGPVPFMPRFFPDTVIPPDPPTYTAAVASSHNNSTLLAATSGSVYSSAHRSYADIPPAFPPPPLDDTMMIPPPPFPVAIRTPIPVLPEGALPPSIPGTVETSRITDSVGIDPPNSAVTPELVPLIQSINNDTRPRSLAVSRRSVDRLETAGVGHNQDDVS